MRIGYIYDFEAYPPRGGNHVHAMELTQGFLRFGHIVSVVDDPTMPGVTSYTSNSEDLERFVKNIDVLYVRIDARLTRHWKVLTECTRLAEDSHPIIWEINSPANETLAYSWLSGKSIDGKERIIRYFRRWMHATRKIPGIFFEEKHRRRMAESVTTAICVSKSLGRYASEGLRIKDALVLPNGAPLISEGEITKRRAHRNWKDFTVLYSGSAMYPWQGLDYLAQVIELARHSAPDIRFVLAVNQRTPDLPSSDNVIILEHLNRDKILDAICAADACVSLHPQYPWSKYNFHNSPMKLFEYMACMTPSVSSNHGQMQEIIHDGIDGLLCENGPHQILEKLNFLKNNPEKASKIGRKGWELIQSKYNWQNNVKLTLNCFEIGLDS